MAPILEWFHSTIAGLGGPGSDEDAFLAARWRVERRGAPRVTDHAVERFRDRYMPTASLAEARLQLTKLSADSNPSEERTDDGGAELRHVGAVAMVVRGRNIVTVLPPIMYEIGR
jgi:hypothetical protein